MKDLYPDFFNDEDKDLAASVSKRMNCDTKELLDLLTKDTPRMNSEKSNLRQRLIELSCEL